MSGTDDYRERLTRAVVMANPEYFIEISREKHAPLPSELKHIVSCTRARLVDWDCAIDVSAMTAMNNVFALKVQPLMHALRDGSRADVQSFAHMGWHASAFTNEDIRNVRKNGGYGFIFEYVCEEGATPYGMQIGFPIAPPLERYRNLSMDSLPNLKIYEDPTCIWTIWRTTILNSIDDVRRRYHRLHIPMPAALEGKTLHRLGAGQATKLITAVAAGDTEKTLVQCNIGQLVRPGNTTDVIADNKASIGSSGEIFDRTNLTRRFIDAVTVARGEHRKIILEILWHHFQVPPDVLLERLLRPEGVLRKKGWNIDHLVDVGHQLAQSVLKS